MKDLSMHIMDIAQNSVDAKASQVNINVSEDSDVIIIELIDNGSGMDAGTVARVTDPFYTSRKTRRVGLGLPLIKMGAEQTGGSLSIVSQPGEGTTVTVRFIASSIDCQPWGDLPQTITLLMVGHPSVNFCFRYCNEEQFDISTNDIKEAVGAENLHNPRAIKLIASIIGENIAQAGFKPDK
jgi:hypothetical protein